MSIANAKDNLRAFNGDGVTAAFPVGFTFRKPTDLVVYRRTAATSVKLDLFDDYGVSGDGLAGAANVTLINPPAIGERIVILRATAARQELELTDLQEVPSNEVEKQFDDQARMVGDAQRATERAITLDVEDTAPFVIPQASERADRVLGFDDAGAPDLIAREDFKGDPGRIDFSGPLADRALHDAAPIGTTYLATDQAPHLFFVREGAPGGWSPGTPYGRGERNDALQRDFANATRPIPSNLLDPQVLAGQMPFGYPFRWLMGTPPDVRFLKLDGKTIGKLTSGADYEGDDLRDYYEMCRLTPWCGNAGTESWEAFDTVKIPDMSGLVDYGLEKPGGTTLQRITTLTTTAGSANATVASAAGLFIGMFVLASTVPVGRTIVDISGTTITLSSGAGVTAGTVATARFSGFTDPQVIGALGGAASHQQLLKELAWHVHGSDDLTWSGSVSGSVSPDPHNHELPTDIEGLAGAGSEEAMQPSGSGGPDTENVSLSWSGSVTGDVGGQTDSVGASLPMPTLPPGRTFPWYAWARRVSIAAPTAYGIDGRYYVYDAATGAGDPGAGRFRFNHADPHLASLLRIDQADSNDRALAAYIASWKTGDMLHLAGISGTGFLMITLAGPPVGLAGHFEVPLVQPSVAHGGQFEAGDAYALLMVPVGPQGIQGQKGWSHVLATVPDGERDVHRVVDWVGGEGTKPAVGQYLGLTGYVDSIVDAKNIRGRPGPAGSSEPAYTAEGRLRGENGMAITLRAPMGEEVFVRDPANAGHAGLYALEDFLAPTLYPLARRVTLEDGTEGWSWHNICPNSEDASQATYGKNGMTAAPPDANGLSLLTAINTTPNLIFSASGANAPANRYYSVADIVKAGTATWVGLAIDGVLGRAYFNLATGAIGQVAAGLFAPAVSISRFDSEGNLLAAGEYRIVVAGLCAGAPSPRLYPVDADGGATCTIGRTIYHRSRQIWTGVKPMRQFRTGATMRNLPYHWSQGRRTLRSLPVLAIIRGGWSEDMTQAAVWALTGCTASLTATGPTGVPCSRIVATAANATIVQSITSAGTTHTSQGKIARRVGNGPLFASADLVTWKDVSAEVPADGAFHRVWAKKTGTNPVIAFRIGTAGDEIDLAEAVSSETNHLIPPIPTRAPAAITRAADVPANIPVSAFMTPAGPVDLSCYWRGLPAADGIGGTGVFGSAPVSSYTISGGPLLWVSAAAVTGFAQTSKRPSVIHLGEFVPERSAEISYVIGESSSEMYASVDGRAPHHTQPTVIPDVENVRLTQGVAGTIDAEELVAVSRRVPVYELQHSWMYSGENTHESVTDEIQLSHYLRLPEVLNNREPILTVTYDRDDEAGGYAGWGELHLLYDSEDPMRFVAREWVLNKRTGKLIVGPITTLYQPPEWHLGKGHSQSKAFLRQRVGRRKRRDHMFYVRQDNASGHYVPASQDLRQMYHRVSDTGLAGFVGAPDNLCRAIPPGQFGFTMGSPSGDVLELPADHPIAPGRLLQAYYSFIQGGALSTGVVYTDPDLDEDPVDSRILTWHQGGTITPPAFEHEPSLFLAPNGDIYLTVRRDGVGTQRQWAKSTDGGETFDPLTYVAASAACLPTSMTVTQADPLGDFGLALGAPLICGPRPFLDTFSRRSFTVEMLRLVGVEIEGSGVKYKPWGDRYGIGYLGARYLKGGWLVVCLEHLGLNEGIGLGNGATNISLSAHRLPAEVIRGRVL